jgi:hypothetical protein
MGESVSTAPLPPLPYRARPPQVLLGVGAVLLVSAGAAVASAHSGTPTRFVLLAVAGTLAGFSLRSARARLRSSEETLAASAAGLALVAIDLGRNVPTGDPAIAAALVVPFLLLSRVSPTTAVWPLAAWAAGQLAVLRALDLLPQQLRTETCLGVALVGLGIALFGRRTVARLALITSAPWWLVGVLWGSSGAWSESGAERWLSAALMIAAACGLLVARLRAVLDPLLGPPRAVPVVAGLVAGAATAGAFSSLGALATTLTGYAGVLLAILSATYLSGWRRGLLLPVALAAGIVMAVLCVARLLAAERWSQLCLLLVLTAVPTVLVAVHRPADRPAAVPTTVGCLAGASLLALPDDLVSPGVAAVLLTMLYGASMLAGALLERETRRATAVAAAACAAAGIVVLVAEGERWDLAAHLAVQGLLTIAWAGLSHRWRRRVTDGPSAAWTIGATQLVIAVWLAAAVDGRTAVEWYSLSAAAGLLLAAGPRLLRGPSWPAWSPGLLVAAVPSTVLAATGADAARAVAVLVVAALAMVLAGRTGVRAPLLVGAFTTLALAVGLSAYALPSPLLAALLVGAALLAVGRLREGRPVAAFGRRLADLR